MTTVKFLKAYKTYKKGDVIEMPEFRAKFLRDNGHLDIIEEDEAKALRAELPTRATYVTK